MPGSVSYVLNPHDTWRRRSRRVMLIGSKLVARIGRENNLAHLTASTMLGVYELQYIF